MSIVSWVHGTVDMVGRVHMSDTWSMLDHIYQTEAWANAESAAMQRDLW